MSELSNLLTDISGKLPDDDNRSLGEMISGARFTTNTAEVFRGRFDADAFVHAGGDYKKPPYIDTIPGEHCGQIAQLQRCYIDSSAIPDYARFRIAADAAMTGCVKGELVNGNPYISMAPANAFSRRPEYLLEYIRTYAATKVWLNATISTEADFSRVRAEANAEIMRREKIYKQYNNAVFCDGLINDDTHDLKYPSENNRISRQGCGYKFCAD